MNKRNDYGNLLPLLKGLEKLNQTWKGGWVLFGCVIPEEVKALVEEKKKYLVICELD